MEERSLRSRCWKVHPFFFPDLERAIFRVSPTMLKRQDILFVSNRGTDPIIEGCTAMS